MQMAGRSGIETLAAKPARQAGETKRSPGGTSWPYRSRTRSSTSESRLRDKLWKKRRGKGERGGEHERERRTEGTRSGGGEGTKERKYSRILVCARAYGYVKPLVRAIFRDPSPQMRRAGKERLPRRLPISKRQNPIGPTTSIRLSSLERATSRARGRETGRIRCSIVSVIAVRSR